MISATAGVVQRRGRRRPGAKFLKINKRCNAALLGVRSKTGGCRFESYRACLEDYASQRVVRWEASLRPWSQVRSASASVSHAA